MTEAEFQKQVVDLAHELGWRVVHIPNRAFKGGWPMYDAKDFPDLALFRKKPNRQGKTKLYWELKESKEAEIKPGQRDWGEWLWPDHEFLCPDEWDWIVQELA